jgi:HprK-related kinase A
MSSNALEAFPVESINAALAGGGLGLQVASYQCKIRSDAAIELAEPLRLLYGHYQASLSPSGFLDIDVQLRRKRVGWRRYKMEFSWDDQSPFPALPVDQTHPLFEWGLNWCISTLMGEDIVIHAAVLERNGSALVLPGEPGSGKSTLCAELCLSGWRLLSDELTIISRVSGNVRPMPRPISLKDASIGLIKSRFPNTVMSTPVGDTHKGTIAYIRPPNDAVARWMHEAPLSQVIFPRFVPAAALRVERLSSAHMLSRLLENTFNVGLLGMEGFSVITQATANTSGHMVEYGDIAEVTAWIETICH